MSCCSNLGWVSFSVTDNLCVKHAECFPRMPVSCFRWNFGRPDFRQAGEEGINLWNDVTACSTHSKSLLLTYSCGVAWEALQTASSSLDIRSSGQVKADMKS